jgi:methionyl-tRNA formyltransferase
MAYLGRDLLLEHLDELLKGKYKTIPQDEVGATYTTKISSNDQIISLQDTKNNIINKIRALNETPGCFIEINNQLIKVFKAAISDIIFSSKGVVESIKKKFLITCLDGTIEILEVQMPSKNRMSAQSFLNGQKFIKIGDEVK